MYKCKIQVDQEAIMIYSSLIDFNNSEKTKPELIAKLYESSIRGGDCELFLVCVKH